MPCDVQIVNFPLEALASAVAARTDAWDRLGLEWRIHPIAPNHGKAVIVSEFESAAWIGDMLTWISGEARRRSKSEEALQPDRVDDLDVLLDELDVLLTDSHVPDAALVWQQPSAPGT
jgi:hypothetical protein